MRDLVGLLSAEVPEVCAQRLLHHWVGDSARVLLVATNRRENEQAWAPIDDLRAEFGEEVIVGQFIVDSVAGQRGPQLGISDLRLAIAQHAADILGGGELLPGAWSRVRDELSNQGSFEIPYADFAALCRERGVRDEDAPRLAAMLHLLGDTLYFADSEGLRERVILQPDWPVGAIDDLLGDQEIRASGGVIVNKSLQRIWSAPPREGRKLSFPSPTHPYLRKLLEQFDLAYRIEDEDGVSLEPRRLLFAPRIPERSHTELPWHQVEAHVRFIWEADDKLPEAVMPMLIARNFDRSTGLHWKGGVFLEDRYHDAQALIELGDAERSLQLGLRGAEADWLFGVRDGIERVLQGWRDLRADLLVPCPRCERGRFDYKQLLGRRKRGKTDASCSGRGACGEDVAIVELLFGLPASGGLIALDPRQVLDGLNEISAKLNEVRASQGKLIAISTEVQSAVGRAAAETGALLRQVLKDLEREGLEGPRLFTLLPPGEGRWRRAARKADPRRHVVELLLWCEYPSGYHPVEEARYLVSIPREWWVRAAPLVRITAQALQMMVPVLVKLPEVLSGEDEVKHLKADLELTERLVGTMVPPNEATRSSFVEGEWASMLPSVRAPDQELLTRLAHDVSGYSAGGLAQGAVLRELHGILHREDPNHRWGGLQRIRVRSSDELAWMCPRHYQEFSQPTGRVSIA